MPHPGSNATWEPLARLQGGRVSRTSRTEVWSEFGPHSTLAAVDAGSAGRALLAYIDHKYKPFSNPTPDPFRTEYLDTRTTYSMLRFERESGPVSQYPDSRVAETNSAFSAKLRHFQFRDS